MANVPSRGKAEFDVTVLRSRVPTKEHFCLTSHKRNERFTLPNLRRANMGNVEFRIESSI